MINFSFFKYIKENQKEDYLNDILDKISKYGIDKISKDEKDFLDSFSNGDSDEVYKNIKSKNILLLPNPNINNVIYDKELNIRFVYLGTKKSNKEERHFGIIEIKKIKMYGHISLYNDFNFETHFYDKNFSDWDLIESEDIYNYEQFIENVINEIDKIPKIESNL